MSDDTEGGGGNSGGGDLLPGDLLKTEFLETLRADFAVHGTEAIAACRADDPLQYIKLIASLLPKDAAPRPPPDTRDALAHLSDDELLARIRGLEAAIDAATDATSCAPAAVGEPGAGARGAQTPHRDAPSAVLPPLR